MKKRSLPARIVRGIVSTVFWVVVSVLVVFVTCASDDVPFGYLLAACGGLGLMALGYRLYHRTVNHWRHRRRTFYQGHGCTLSRRGQ